MSPYYGRRGYGSRPGEGRSFGRAGPSSRTGRSHGASRLSIDDVDALFSAVGRVRFVAFDFETTGLSPERDRVVEIGAVAFRMVMDEAGPDGRPWRADEEGSYETLVHPGRPIPSEVSAIHGIDDLAVSGAPSFAEAAARFLPFIDGSILVAHNAPFDLGFLRAETARAGLENPPNPAYDTIAIAKTAISGLPSYSLKALASAFGIVQTAAHRGGDDARVCMNLFSYCINLIHTSK
ncbi:MAG TPA: 3'-5' exonuclease [Spirochaetia bacterium]|nr:3'-5' exonuclease [Spirochaetia bacterium]